MSDINASYAQFSQQQMVDSAGVDETGGSKRGGRAGAAGGWLVAFATAMGKLIEKAGEALMNKAEAIGDKPTAADSTELTVQSQMYSMFINAVSTALKTMGEAQGAMAKRN
ncbi:hypothetical protein K4L06_07980 [Lysobacter sp. BMK333-48F3]|uniref:Uncharacterized protein n=1 Tax=Lysobacter firmicutimachus TaxID=1792846 RepID=A0AAU8MWN4_9GAMM|nr:MULTISPECIES: hypothetical protein [Lysobacter]MBX9401250.1 hypothetical protein [Lysobacter sp. BMK333-48F3]